VIHEYARAFALALDQDTDVNQREIRTADGYLRVVASDAPKLMGLTPTLAIVDELHAHKDESVYVALRTALLKRPGAKMATISTPGMGSRRRWAGCARELLLGTCACMRNRDRVAIPVCTAMHPCAERGLNRADWI
jgi:Phage Terminase